MISNRKASLLRLSIWLVAGLMVALCIAVIVLAMQGDTTALGDPYYETNIMAWQRALIPWLMTWFIVFLSVGLAYLGSNRA